jgi:hypothetical protein
MTWALGDGFIELKVLKTFSLSRFQWLHYQIKFLAALTATSKKGHSSQLVHLFASSQAQGSLT